MCISMIALMGGAVRSAPLPKGDGADPLQRGRSQPNLSTVRPTLRKRMGA
jgi:hypothetical protein